MLRPIDLALTADGRLTLFGNHSGSVSSPRRTPSKDYRCAFGKGRPAVSALLFQQTSL